MLSVALKGLAGGSLVVIFSLLCDALVPKRFAGLFSAAPAVALASLSITVASEGAADARRSSLTMIAGAVALAVYAAAVAPLLRHHRPAPVAAVLALGWLALAFGLALL